MVKGMIFDIGGVLGHDVWENLFPALDKQGGIAAKFDLNKDHVHRVGELLWEAFAHRQEGPYNTWRELEHHELEHQYRDLFKFFWSRSPPKEASAEQFIRMTGKFIKPVDHAYRFSPPPRQRAGRLQNVIIEIEGRAHDANMHHASCVKWGAPWAGSGVCLSPQAL